MKEQLDQIQQRNRRVEADKAWETSKTRRGLIAIITYCMVVLFLWLIEIPKPWVNAIIPTMGFLLSTLTLSVFKKKWLKKFYP